VNNSYEKAIYNTENNFVAFGKKSVPISAIHVQEPGAVALDVEGLVGGRDFVARLEFEF